MSNNSIVNLKSSLIRNGMTGTWNMLKKYLDKQDNNCEANTEELKQIINQVKQEIEDRGNVSEAEQKDIENLFK